MRGGTCFSSTLRGRQGHPLPAPSRQHRTGAATSPRPHAATSPRGSGRHPTPWPSPSQRIPRQVMCLAQVPQGSGSPPPSPSSSSEPIFKYLDPINRALSNLLPPSRDAAAELAHIDWGAAKVQGRSLEALAAVIEEKLVASEWFVTGEVDPSLFDDGFVFRDDNVATAGVQSYATGVRKLFDQATARAQVIVVTPDAAQASVVVTWRLEGRVNLPLRPSIPPYIVTTTLAVDANGLICSQVDEFGVPGWQLLAGALLGAWAGPEPAPPVEQLRAAAGAAAAGRKE